ncbi:hypothetical protein AOQ84DRAFT_355893 [Glonium stellatum]|uniref:Uncharacterized protein n=1 Tax=Glonium stellatum TaxID=574774 RepID=A0A8E2EVF4_9PEZI|nr:hypothetical protein AOQ84DRAFT_355893 [Glonium stellatum]
MSSPRLPFYLIAAPIFLLCYNSIRFVEATSIETFSDDACQKSYRSINGPDGYPNGTCTHLDSQGPFSSFQVVQEDNGCTVTIYGNDTIPGEPCSATALQFAEIATCYNASWVYYSIDACIPPGSSSTASSNPTSSSTPQSHHSNHTGAIAGGVVGGVVGLAILVGIAIFFFVRRRRRQRQQPDDPHEMPDAHVPEMHAKEAEPELPAPQGTAELGRNSQYITASELPGNHEEQAEKPKEVIRPETPLEMQGNDSWLPGDDAVGTTEEPRSKA